MRIEFARRRPTGYINPPSGLKFLLLSLYKEYKNKWRKDPVLVRVSKGIPDSVLSTVGVAEKTARNGRWIRIL